MIYDTDDTRITDIIAVATPVVLFDEFPITEKASQTTFQTRRELHDILKGKDDRLLVIAGPCSIHDPEAAIEYLNYAFKVFASGIEPDRARAGDSPYLSMDLTKEYPLLPKMIAGEKQNTVSFVPDCKRKHTA